MTSILKEKSCVMILEIKTCWLRVTLFLAEWFHSQTSFLQLVVGRLCDICPHRWAQNPMFHSCWRMSCKTGFKYVSRWVCVCVSVESVQGMQTCIFVCVYTPPHQVAYLRPEYAWEKLHTHTNFLFPSVFFQM